MYIAFILKIIDIFNLFFALLLVKAIFINSMKI
jgi:hypothetical protein